MATFSFDNAYLTVNAVDVSDHVRSITLDVSAEELDDSAMGDTYRSRIGGVKDWSITVEFNQDFADSSIDDTLFAALGTVVAVQFNPDSSTTGSNNPRYSGNVLISQVPVVSNSYGDLATISVTWPGAGTLSRAEA